MYACLGGDHDPNVVLWRCIGSCTSHPMLNGATKKLLTKASVLQFSVLSSIEGSENLLDLPEVPPLVGGKHAERAIHVVAYARAHRRLNLYFVDGKASSRIYRVDELILRLKETNPSGIEILMLRHKLGRDVEPKSVGRF